MAIDFVLGVSCEPKKRLGVERLVGLHRTREIARSALVHMRREGEDRPPSEIEVQLTTRKPDGDTARAVTLGSMLDETAPLDEVAPLCEECPARLPSEFACHRRINYPISEAMEAYLMSRLPARLGCTAGALLVRGLGEFGWDGAPVAKLRASGETYFESRVALGVRWDGGSTSAAGGRIELSSDQIFQMMFMVGHLAPTHSLMLALFMGVIPHDISLHDLKAGPSRDRALAEADVAVETDASLEQLAVFLRMLATAARLDAPILIDG